MNKIRYIFIFSLLLSYFNVSQATDYYFFVQFKDKSNSPYSLAKPTEFLSSRSLARRISFGVNCDSTDLPVNHTYVQQISSLGIKIHSRTKWLNGVTIATSDSTIMSQVRVLPFVKKTQYTGKMEASSSKISKMKLETDTVRYGSTNAQVYQLNLKKIQNEGYRGKGIMIGILDAGFYNADTNPGLDSLRIQGRLLGSKDIILPGNNVYAEDTHGANVLSIIEGNLPGYFYGTAPQASVWLIRTEYAPTENLYEPDFWVSGIEFADSVGVDIINSSLGYTTFDDSTMSYSYSNMNGKTGRASIAANMAANKGIIVCNCAGNDGNKDWHYIGSPADADGIFTVGAVTSTGTSSDFSSFGPTADGRTKPDVCAMGTATAIINSAGDVNYGSGTSYASPVMCGALACLLQKYKATIAAPLSLNDFRNAIIMSANLYKTPTAQSGYGIPDIVKAFQILSTLHGLTNYSPVKSPVKLTLEDNSLHISVSPEFIGKKIIYNIYNLAGIQIAGGVIDQEQIQIDCKSYSYGLYIMNIVSGETFANYKFIISTK